MTSRRKISSTSLEDATRKHTNSHRYFAVDHLLAEMLLKSYDGDRRQTLHQASRLYDSFLTRLDQYNILSTNDKKLYDQFQESQASFALAASTNAEERRRVKVARFQEEKALKTRLEVKCHVSPNRMWLIDVLVLKE